MNVVLYRMQMKLLWPTPFRHLDLRRVAEGTGNLQGRQFTARHLNTEGLEQQTDGSMQHSATCLCIVNT